MNSLSLPSKPPLITPSASPPPARSFHALPLQMSDNSRPFERQRLFSTPRRTIRDAHAPSSTPQIQSPVDVVKERDASIHRLLDHWASLADRYTRRLDEDDIVDLQLNEVTRDNGILRNSRKFEFGALAASSTGYITGDEGSEGSDSQEDEEDVYDLDELDAFAETYSDTDGEARTKCNLKAGVVPPVSPLDPADAADLQEFMEAEQKRKEVCGSDFDEGEEGDLDDPLPEAFDDQAEEVGFSSLDEVERRSIEEGDELISEGEGHAGERDADEGVEGFVLPAAVVGSLSQDELDNWEVDETNDPGPVSNREDEVNNSDSDIEIIEPPMLFAPSKSQPPNKSVLPKNTPTRHLSRIPQKIPCQLHTPPESQASSGPSLTPTRGQSLDEWKTYLASPSNGPDISSLSQSCPSSEPSYLETPTKKAVPKLNLALLSKTPRKLFKDLPHSAHASGSASESNPPLPNPKLKPFVLLAPRKSAKSNPSTPRSVQPHHRGAENETEERSPINSSKGKERAIDNVRYKDDEVERPSPSKPSKGKGRARDLTDIIVDSEPRTKPTAIRYQTSPSNHATNDKYPHRAPSNEDSDDPILISPPLHRSLHPSTVEEDKEFFVSGTSTSSRTQGSYIAPSSSSFSHDVKPTLFAESQKTKPSKKRKRTISDLTTELPNGQSPEKKLDRRDSPSRHPSSHAWSSRFIDARRSSSHSPKNRSSSRHQRRESHSESERESESSVSERNNRRQRRRSRSRCKTHPVALHPYSNPCSSQFHPPQNYPPIQDPRAQLIITNAMQQLSSLVGAPWVPGHPYPGAVPHTPTHHHVSERPSDNQYVTPTHHHHPYPYSYDPCLSHATLPPNSPDNNSSPENSPLLPLPLRRTLVRRSHSRGRRVSFIVEEDNQNSHVMELQSSPLGLPLSSANSRSQGGMKIPKARIDLVPPSDADSVEESDSVSRATRFPRGRTPGPTIELPTRGKQATPKLRKPRGDERDIDG